MKLKLVTASLFALTTSSLFADTNAALSALQAQINALQTQVNAMGTPAGGLGVGLDTASPFGTLSKVQMPLQLVKNRNSATPTVVLGGQLEADLQAWNGSNLTTHQGTPYGNGSSGTSVAFTKLYLFTEANLSQNALGFISLKNTLPSDSLAIDRAFLILGQLNNTSPLFVTLGSTYLPFGSFSGNGPLNNTLTTNVFRVSPTNQASAEGVFGPVTLVASAYNNSSSVNDSVNGLFSAYLNEKFGSMHYNFGASYLNNVVGTNSGLGSAFGNGCE